MFSIQDKSLFPMVHSCPTHGFNNRQSLKGAIVLNYLLSVILSIRDDHRRAVFFATYFFSITLVNCRRGLRSRLACYISNKITN